MLVHRHQVLLILHTKLLQPQMVRRRQMLIQLILVLHHHHHHMEHMVFHQVVIFQEQWVLLHQLMFMVPHQQLVWFRVDQIIIHHLQCLIQCIMFHINPNLCIIGKWINKKTKKQILSLVFLIFCLSIVLFPYCFTFLSFCS